MEVNMTEKEELVFQVNAPQKPAGAAAARITGFLAAAALCVAFPFTACSEQAPPSVPGGNAVKEKNMERPDSWVSPYERYGRIQIADVDHDGDSATAPRRQLCDEWGAPVQLRGMSSFGLQWGDGDWILTDEVFDVLAYDWQCEIIRLAMYINEDGYAQHPAELLAKVEKGIELAGRRGLYTIVDWHCLSPGSPNDPVYLKAGIDLPEYAEIRRLHPEYTGPELFFAYLSQKYSDLPILWEIMNEPNGLGPEHDSAEVWKTELLPYAQRVLRAIRSGAKDKQYDNIVICGTDNWSQFVDAPVRNPVIDRNNQIMYAVHFYSGTHDAGYGSQEQYWLRNKILDALKGGLAVFCTEWGLSLATGDDGPYIDFAERWLEFLERNKISWCSWSLGRKAEVSSAALPNASAHPFDRNGDGIPEWDWDSELSVTGRFIRAKIRGDEAPLYAGPGGPHNGDFRYLPPDEKGTFIKFPFDFESGQREGWAKEGPSAVNQLDIKISMAETKALSFPVKFNTFNNAWEDGSRLSSGHFPIEAMDLEHSRRIKGVSLDLFIEKGVMTTGALALTICPIPDGDGYWYQTDQIEITGEQGIEVLSPDGKELLKFYVTVPLFPEGSYPFTVRIRNLITVLSSAASDYAGIVYYDNIGFLY
jgi:endoglucanase